MFIPKDGSLKHAYDMGYDCGRRGASDQNCHFSIFSSHEKMKAWEEGKKDAEANKPKR